jgi:NodT family efflux transporter outer membrane factor (OMF) lipoprotein
LSKLPNLMDRVGRSSPRVAAWVRVLSPAAVAVLIAGCASMGGLDPAATPRATETLAASRALADAPVSPAQWPATDWWRAFGDPQLDALVDEALATSPTLAVASARTRKALAFAAARKAPLSPQVNGTAASTRERFSANGLAPPPLGGSVRTENELQATLAWEIDFWGRNRAAYDAAVGAARAAEIDAQAARLALSTTVAQAYVQLERTYLLRDVAQATLREREQIAALTRDRNDAGLDSRLEVKQADAALPTTREQLAQLDERAGLLRNQIAALLGAGPDRGLAIERPAAIVRSRTGLPSTLPAELVGRRPDIVAQRWRIEAAGRDIASAKAAFYPNVNLVAFVGLQSLGGGSLLTAASRMAGIGPAISLPIFDAGRLRANLAGRDADYDVAVEQYNQALADALRDVVDQLVSLRSVDEQRRQQRDATATAQEAYDLAVVRFREGLGNYLQVLSAEQPLLAQRSLDADLTARELEIDINLIRALGGGYAPSPSVAETKAIRP